MTELSDEDIQTYLDQAAVEFSNTFLEQLQSDSTINEANSIFVPDLVYEHMNKWI